MLSPHILITNLTLPIYIHLLTVSEVLPRYFIHYPLLVFFSTHHRIFDIRLAYTPSDASYLISKSPSAFRSISCGFRRVLSRSFTYIFPSRFLTPSTAFSTFHPLTRSQMRRISFHKVPRCPVIVFQRFLKVFTAYFRFPFPYRVFQPLTPHFRNLAVTYTPEHPNLSRKHTWTHTNYFHILSEGFHCAFSSPVGVVLQ